MMEKIQQEKSLYLEYNKCTEQGRLEYLAQDLERAKSKTTLGV